MLQSNLELKLKHEGSRGTLVCNPEVALMSITHHHCLCASSGTLQPTRPCIEFTFFTTHGFQFALCSIFVSSGPTGSLTVVLQHPRVDPEMHQAKAHRTVLAITDDETNDGRLPEAVEHYQSKPQRRGDVGWSANSSRAEMQV
jgi:hypothetical protein